MNKVFSLNHRWFIVEGRQKEFYAAYLKGCGVYWAAYGVIVDTWDKERRDCRVTFRLKNKSNKSSNEIENLTAEEILHAEWEDDYKFGVSIKDAENYVWDAEKRRYMKERQKQEEEERKKRAAGYQWPPESVYLNRSSVLEDVEEMDFEHAIDFFRHHRGLKVIADQTLDGWEAGSSLYDVFLRKEGCQGSKAIYLRDIDGDVDEFIDKIYLFKDVDQIKDKLKYDKLYEAWL